VLRASRLQARLVGLARHTSYRRRQESSVPLMHQNALAKSEGHQTALYHSSLVFPLFPDYTRKALLDYRFPIESSLILPNFPTCPNHLNPPPGSLTPLAPITSTPHQPHSPKLFAPQPHPNTPPQQPTPIAHPNSPPQQPTLTQHPTPQHHTQPPPRPLLECMLPLIPTLRRARMAPLGTACLSP